MPGHGAPRAGNSLIREKEDRKRSSEPFDKAEPRKYNGRAVLGNLREKLARTRQAFRKFEDLFRSGKSREEVLDDLAEAMILADIGVGTTGKIIEAIRAKTRKDDPPEALKTALRDEIAALLVRFEAPFAPGPGPSVVLMVGVNGGGTTPWPSWPAGPGARGGRS
jgi:signal recognition particle GTPase